MADGSQTTELTVQPEQSPRAHGLGQIRTVQDAVPTLDTARFEHMQRIATVMAASSLVPETLRKDLEREAVLANCFLVVNQAVRWGMDPFAVAQCCSVVHGRICYEGKLVHAVIEAKLGVRLKYAFDEGKGDALGVTVSGQLPGEDEERTVDGTVAQWKTNGNNSPWSSPANWKRQLRYRGAREWARAHAPAVLLGVYSDDEMDGLVVRRARDITPAAAPLGAAPQAQLPAPKGPPPAPPKGPPSAPAQKLIVPAGGDISEPVLTHKADSMPDPIAAPVAYRKHLDAEMACCGDEVTLVECWEAYESVTGRMGREHRLLVEQDYERHVQRIKGGGEAS
jgi:hypothetical protein